MKKETKKKVDWRAIRISNRKVNSLQEYWDIFPGLKEEIFKKPKSEKDYALRRKSLDKSILNNDAARKFISVTIAKIDEYMETWYTRFIVNAKDVDLETEPERLKNEIKALHKGIIEENTIVDIRFDAIWKTMKDEVRMLKENGIQSVKQFEYFRHNYAQDLGIDIPNTYLIDSLTSTMFSVERSIYKNYPLLQEMEEVTKKYIKVAKEKDKDNIKKFEEVMDGYIEKVTEEDLKKYIREDWLCAFKNVAMTPLYYIFDNLYDKFEKWTGLETEYELF